MDKQAPSVPHSVAELPSAKQKLAMVYQDNLIMTRSGKNKEGGWAFLPISKAQPVAIKWEDFTLTITKEIDAGNGEVHHTRLRLDRRNRSGGHQQPGVAQDGQARRGYTVSSRRG